MWSEPYIRWSKSVRSSENLFLPSGSLESEESIALPVSINQNLWKRVCRLSGPQIENEAELYNFIEKAVSAKAEADLKREAGCEDFTKRALLTTCHAGTKPLKNTAQRQQTDHRLVTF